MDNKEAMSEIVAVFECDRKISLQLGLNIELGFRRANHLTECTFIKRFVEFVDIMDCYPGDVFRQHGYGKV